jgi:transcriptional regulator with XRE-family HTH domain
MDAARLVKQARARAGLSQRDLAALTGIPQPMISAIERGLQDPRHGTLDRLLRGCGQELDLVIKPGEGVDPTQYDTLLKASLRTRLASTADDARWLAQLDRARLSMKPR